MSKVNDKKWIPVYCPDCAAAKLPPRLLLYVERETRGIIHPYCKGCKENKTIQLNQSK